MNPPEYKDMKSWHLIDKIKILGWLIDDMFEIDWETTVEMLKDKLDRIGKIVDINSPCIKSTNNQARAEKDGHTLKDSVLPGSESVQIASKTGGEK